MHGGRHGGDNVGVITGNDRMRHKYGMPAETRFALGKSRIYCRGHYTARTCTLFPSTLLVEEEIPADTHSSGVTNPTSPHMLLLLLSGRLLVVLTSAPALSWLLLPGTTILPPHPLALLPKQLALRRNSHAPSAARAGATISCLWIRCCQTQTRCLRGAPRCRRVGQSGNVHSSTKWAVP